MKNITRRQAVAILLVSPLLSFWKIFFAHSDYSFFTSNDAAQHWYPWYQYLGMWAHRWVIPLWDATLQSGRPLLGEMRPGILYPLNLLLGIVGGRNTGMSLTAMDLSIVLAVVLASIFEYQLSRYLGMSRFASLTAAILYGYAGFILENATWQISILNGIIWMPLLLSLFLRSLRSEDGRTRYFYLVSSGVVLGFMILAGHIEPPVHAGLFLMFTAIHFAWSGPPNQRSRIWKSLAALVGVTAAAALSAAPQLFAAWEYGRRSLRWLGWGDLPAVNPLDPIPYAWGGHFERGHLQDLFTAIDPGLWAGSDYFGVAALVLVATAFPFVKGAHARFFKTALVLSVLLWLGENSVLHGILYRLIPFLDKVRQPSRAIFPMHFCIATLAGFGADFLARSIRKPLKLRSYQFSRVFLGAGSAISIAIFLVGMLAILFKASTMVDEPLEWTLRFAFLLFAVLLLVYLRHLGMIRLPLFRSLLLAVIAFDLFSFFSYSIQSRQTYNSKNNYYPPTHYAPNNTVRFLQDRASRELFRVQVMGDALPINSGMVHGFQEVTGSTATALQSYQDFRSIDWDPDSIIQRLLNRRYVVSREPLAGFRQILAGSPILYEDPGAIDRVQWVPNCEIADDSAQAANALRNPAFNPRKTAILTPEYAAFVPSGLRAGIADSPSGSARILRYEPNRIVAFCSAPQTGFLLLSEVFYPGWKVTIDGKQSPLIRADLLLRAVVVPAGEHTVEFRYWPSYFTVGLVMMLAVYGLFAFLWISCCRQRRL